jgi:hypothetical protein
MAVDTMNVGGNKIFITLMSICLGVNRMFNPQKTFFGPVPPPISCNFPVGGMTN